MQRALHLSTRVLAVLAVVISMSAGALALATPATAAENPRLVPSDRETVPGAHSGDTIDDPAIWVNPADPSRSLVIANDKRGALNTYDLDGQLVQTLAFGSQFWGNVDVRQAVTIGGTTRDLVGVVQQGVRFYTVDPTTRLLSPVTEGGNPIGVTGAEGFCMYQSPVTHKVYGISISREGDTVNEFELLDEDADGLLESRTVRTFHVGSVAEGCVADDETGALYISQEDNALWRYDAEPDGGTTREAVDVLIGSGGHLVDDIEGVTVVDQPDGHGYLIASAQNVADPNASYFGVYRREAGNDFVNTFRVADGTTSDDCDRTDGVAATTADLGPAFPRGLFVCQDNNNNLPGTSGNQDLKLVGLDKVVDLDATGPPPPPPPGNQPPTARFTYTCGGFVCDFDGSSSSDDEDGTVATYSWDFGDGGTSDEAAPRHDFGSSGSRQVTLTVTDTGDATDSDTQAVAVDDGTPSAAISFVGQSTLNANQRSFSVTVPAGVQTGDALLLFASQAGTAALTGPGAGWTQVGRTTDTNHTTWIWRRVATASDAGSTVQVGTGSTYTKLGLTIAAYAGTDTTNPVAAVSGLAEPGNTAAHTTPVVDNTDSGAWRVSYWSDKNSATTSWTGPADEVRRASTVGSGGGRVGTLLTDSGDSVATGNQGGLTGTANAAASSATSWTLLLRPAATD